MAYCTQSAAETESMDGDSIQQHDDDEEDDDESGESEEVICPGACLDGRFSSGGPRSPLPPASATNSV